MGTVSQSLLQEIKVICKHHYYLDVLNEWSEWIVAVSTKTNIYSHMEIEVLGLCKGSFWFCMEAECFVWKQDHCL